MRRRGGGGEGGREGGRDYQARRGERLEPEHRDFFAVDRDSTNHLVSCPDAIFDVVDVCDLQVAAIERGVLQGSRVADKLCTGQRTDA